MSTRCLGCLFLALLLAMAGCASATEPDLRLVTAIQAQDGRAGARAPARGCRCERGARRRCDRTVVGRALGRPGHRGSAVGGRYLQYEQGTPLANLHLALLDKVGIHLDTFGDSTGKLNNLGDQILPDL